MKVYIHKAASRGYGDYSWVKSFHSFNFASYFNPLRERLGVIRVLNDEVLEPAGKFEMHKHKNLEIVIMPIKGTLIQEDEGGNKSLIGENEVQIISAGSGIRHSIGNASETESAELIQIWLFPKTKNTEPRYQAMEFNPDERNDRLQWIVSPSLISDILRINQDAWISRLDLKPNISFRYEIMKDKNYVFVFVLEGNVILKQKTEEMQKIYPAERRDSIELQEISNDFILTSPLGCSLLIIDAPPD